MLEPDFLCKKIFKLGVKSNFYIFSNVLTHFAEVASNGEHPCGSEWKCGGHKNTGNLGSSLRTGQLTCQGGGDGTQQTFPSPGPDTSWKLV